MSAAEQDIPKGTGLHVVTTDDSRSRRLADFGDALAARLPGLKATRRHEPGNEAPHFILPGGVRYMGVPEGREAAPFMDALCGRLPAPPQPLAERLSALRLPAALSLYVAARCTFCPRAVRSLVPLALAQPRVRLTVVDAELFTELAERDQVRALPTLVIDGRMRWSGTIDVVEVIGLLANRDPAAIGPVALEMMLKEGRAREVAGMMRASRRVFPALLDLLVHPQWPVRLGAMVTVEELAAQEAGLAQTAIDPLWDRFAAAPDAVKGDVLYLVGEFGRPSDLDRIRGAVRDDDSEDLREAAAEAAGKLTETINAQNMKR